MGALGLFISQVLPTNSGLLLLFLTWEMFFSTCGHRPFHCRW